MISIVYVIHHKFGYGMRWLAWGAPVGRVMSQRHPSECVWIVPGTYNGED